MARSIKIGDEITTSILNSVETTITANLLSGEVPNFAACKAVATRLSNYVAACEAHFEEVKAAQQPKVVEGLTPEESAVFQALLAKVKPEASKPKAPTKPKATKPKADKSAKPTRRKKTVGQRLAAKAGQGAKAKNVVLEARQQASFVSALPTI